MSLNMYVYARDNPMKIADMNGHEWWDPVADLTTAASDVVGAATDVANAASNAWNSLPPGDQQTIEVGVVAAVSAVAIGVTLGTDAPIVGAADVGAIGAIEARGDVAATTVAEAGTDALISTGGETADEAASSTLLNSITKLAISMGKGAVSNAAVTVASDLATGQKITPNQIGQSLLVGAATGGLTYGLTSDTVGLGVGSARRAIAYVGAGGIGTLLNTAISSDSPSTTGMNFGIKAAGGTAGAGLEDSYPFLSSVIRYGLGFVGRVW